MNKEKETVTVSLTPEKAGRRRRRQRKPYQKTMLKTKVRNPQKIQEKLVTKVKNADKLVEWKDPLHKGRRVTRSYKPKGDNGVLQVIEAITMPADSPNVRLGRGWGDEPTGVATLIDRPQTSFAGDVGNNGFAAVFRHPLRAAVVQWAQSDVLPCRYRLVQTLEIAESDSSFFDRPLRLDGGPGFHGSILYPGKLNEADGHAGYWMNVGDNVVLNMLTSLAGEIWVFEVWMWGGGKWVNKFNSNWSPGSGGTTVASYTHDSSPAYIAFSISMPGGRNVNSYLKTIRLDLSIGSAPDTGQRYYSHLSLPDLDNNIPSVKNVKINGASLMFTNTSNALARNGNVAMAQVPARNSWENYVGSQILTKMNPQRSKVIEANEGAYLFLKPSCIEDVTQFSNAYTLVEPDSSLQPLVDGGTDAEYETAFFKLLEDNEFIVMDLDIPLVGTTENRAGYWTLAYKVEFNSDDRWRALQIGQIPEADITSALALVSAAPQFHANDFHISDIWNWIKDAASTVVNGIMEYGPTVLKVAGTVAPLLALL